MTALSRVPAIYRDGMIHPLKSLDLPNNALIDLQISPRKQKRRGRLAKYRGVLAGRGEFDYQDMQTTIDDALKTHVEKLIGKLDEEAP